MANVHGSQGSAPVAPALLHPREAAIVDGAAVTFVWKEVEGADAYRIEVAADPGFENVVFEQDLPLRTRLTVANLFPADENVYFWRVLARTGDAWSSDEHVESFTSASAERVAEFNKVPDQTEKLGPVAELFRADAQEVAAELRSDPSMKDWESSEGVEQDRVAVGQIMGLALGVLTVLVVAILVVFQWTGMRAQQTGLAVTGTSGYPELRKNTNEAIQRLSNYGVVDPDRQVYHIPIERAMDLLVTESATRGNTGYSPELPLPQGN